MNNEIQLTRSKVHKRHWQLPLQE